MRRGKLSGGGGESGCRVTSDLEVWGAQPHKGTAQHFAKMVCSVWVCSAIILAAKQCSGYNVFLSFSCRAGNTDCSSRAQ